MADAVISVARPDEFGQPARWRAFRNPQVEADYRAWHLARILPVARLVAISSATLFGIAPATFALLVERPPSLLVLSTYAIAVPTSLLVLLATFTKLQPWTNETFTLGNAVLGLNFVWFTNGIFGAASGAFVCGVLATIFYPLVLRIRTATSAIAVFTLTVVPVVLVFENLRRGDLAPPVGWFYIVVLVSTMPVVIFAAALIEAGMRKQFTTERTVARQQSQLQASQRLLRRYAPSAVAGRIEAGDAEAVGHPQRLRVTALSSDVAGFTVLADQIDPESLSQIINEYMATMSDVVETQGGVVTEFAGDGLMAIFGAPELLEPEEQVRRALSTAHAMHARLAELNKTWFRLGIEQPLQVRIGINTGMLSVGTFGSDGRATYTAIGLQMNVAARIQAQCEPGGILLSSASWHLVSDTVECDALGEVTVKGVHFPISVYSPR